MKCGRTAELDFIVKKYGDIFVTVDLGKTFPSISSAHLSIYYYHTYPALLERGDKFPYQVIATTPMTSEMDPTWSNRPSDEIVLTPDGSVLQVSALYDDQPRELKFTIDNVDYLENKQTFTLKLIWKWYLFGSGWDTIYCRSSESADVGARPKFVVDYDDGKNIFEAAFAWLMSAIGSIFAFIAILSSCLFINRKKKRPLV